MDEVKKKYLQDLHKQIDPAVLEKMVKHFGGGDDGESAPTPAPSSAPTAVEMIRQRRLTNFHETLARRKMEDLAVSLKKDEKPKVNRTIFILSDHKIWMKILQNKFTSFGFNRVKSFTNLASLIRFILNGMSSKGLGEFAVAVSYKEIAGFVQAWENIKKVAAEKKIKSLDDVPFFLTVETPKQIDGHIVDKYGFDRFICLSDDVDMNREKIARVMT